MGKSLGWMVLGVVVFIIAGMVVVSVLGALFKLAVYLMVGAVVVGGAFYLVSKARRAIGGDGPRQLR